MVRILTLIDSIYIYTYMNLRTNLTRSEKLEYIDGDLCLMSTPAKSGIPGAKTRWDELQYAHIVQTEYVHGVVRQYRIQ